MGYLGEKQIGNFKRTRTERAKPAKAKERDGNDGAYLAAVRRLPCLVTLREPAHEAHHLKQGTGERGAGMRSSDKWAVPLSAEPHRIDGDCVEKAGSKNEHAWFRARGISDPLGCAKALWDAYPDEEKMRSIVYAHNGGFYK